MIEKLKPINWIQWLTLVLAVAVIAGIFVLEQVARATNDAQRKVYCYFEQATLADPRLTVDDKKRTVRVFGHALSLINEPPCR